MKESPHKRRKLENPVSTPEEKPRTRRFYNRLFVGDTNFSAASAMLTKNLYRKGMGKSLFIADDRSEKVAISKKTEKKFIFFA